MKSKFNPWPSGIIAAFALFFSGVATVVVIAATHREHLVSANYYEQELKFQGQIDAAARAWKSGATIVNDSAAGVVAITLPAARMAHPVSGRVEFYRPSAPELDREFPLEPTSDGTQTLDVSRLASGPWLVRVKWSAGGESYFLEQKITVAGK